MFAFSVFSAVSGLYIRLKDPLLRVFSKLNVSNIIGGGSEVVRESSAVFLSLAICARASGVYFPPNLLGVLRSCRRVALFLRYLLAGVLGILLVPKGSLFSWGSKIIGGISPRLRVMSWEFFYLPSFIVVQ